MGMHSYGHEPIWLKLSIIDIIETCNLIVVSVALTFIGSHGCEEANTDQPIISQSFDSIWLQFGMLWSLLVRWSLFILSGSISIQRRELYFRDFVNQI